MCFVQSSGAKKWQSVSDPVPRKQILRRLAWRESHGEGSWEQHPESSTEQKEKVKHDTDIALTSVYLLQNSGLRSPSDLF